MHSLNYLLYTCSPLCKHQCSYQDKSCPSIKMRLCAQTRTIILCIWYKIIFTCTSSLPGLWSVTQVVVKTAALRRAGAHWGDKFTYGHVEPQEQDEEHFGPLLRIRSLPTCASLRPLKSNRLGFFSHLQEYHPHGFVPPLRCPIVIRLLWVPR